MWKPGRRREIRRRSRPRAGDVGACQPREAAPQKETSASGEPWAGQQRVLGHCVPGPPGFPLALPRSCLKLWANELLNFTG